MDRLSDAALGTTHRVRQPVQWGVVAESICTYLDTNRHKVASRVVPDVFGRVDHAVCKESNMVYPSVSGLGPPHSTTIALVTTDALLPKETLWRVGQRCLDLALPPFRGHGLCGFLRFRDLE
jgi:L-aminopeptidase/D-esterase-like protein